VRLLLGLSPWLPMAQTIGFEAHPGLQDIAGPNGLSHRLRLDGHCRIGVGIRLLPTPQDRPTIEGGEVQRASVAQFSGRAPMARGDWARWNYYRTQRASRSVGGRAAAIGHDRQRCTDSNRRSRTRTRAVNPRCHDASLVLMETALPSSQTRWNVLRAHTPQGI
jgi:hypothetical protein